MNIRDIAAVIFGDHRSELYARGDAEVAALKNAAAQARAWESCRSLPVQPFIIIASATTPLPEKPMTTSDNFRDSMATLLADAKATAQTRDELEKVRKDRDFWKSDYVRILAKRDAAGTMVLTQAKRIKELEVARDGLATSVIQQNDEVYNLSKRNEQLRADIIRLNRLAYPTLYAPMPNYIDYSSPGQTFNGSLR